MKFIGNKEAKTTEINKKDRVRDGQLDMPIDSISL